MDGESNKQRRLRWQAIFERVNQAPIGEAEKERLRHYTIFLVVGLPFLAAFAVYDLFIAKYLLAAMIVVYMTVVVLCWFVLQRMPNGQTVYRNVAGLYFALILYIVALADQEGSKILWVYTFPLITFFILGQKEGIFWVGGLFTIMVFLLWVPVEWLDVFSYPEAFKIRFLASFLIVAAITCWYDFFRHRYKKDWQREHRQLETEKQRLHIEISERKKVERERESLIAELKETLDKVNTLRGLIPICANCHSIRDDQGYWNHLESFFQRHSDAEFSHGICPECKRALYPDLYPEE